MQSFQFEDGTVKVLSETGTFLIEWKKVCKVQELKPGFLIYISPNTHFIIPKRCFNGEIQLKMFLNILIKKVEKNKLKLKKYKVGKFSPDIGEIPDSLTNVQTIESALTEPLLEARFSLSKKELLEINFINYYTKPIGITFTIIGIFFLHIFVQNIIDYDDMLPLIVTLATPIGLGVMFTFVIPYSIYNTTVQGFKKDSSMNKQRMYKFYSDYFCVEHSRGTSCVKWNELVKVREVKSAFLLFSAPRLFHFIPKRVLEENSQEVEVFRNILYTNFPKIKK